MNRSNGAAPPPSPRWRTAAWPALVALVVAATLSNTLSNGFVWDDFDIIVDNPQTHDVANLGEVLLSPDLTPPYYRPVARGLFVLEHALWGLDPAPYHALSLALHVLAALLLFAWTRTLLAWGRRRSPAIAPGVAPRGPSVPSAPDESARAPAAGRWDTAVAAVAALLWGCHPVVSEAVGFISVRTNPLVVLFMLASLLVFTRGVTGGGALARWAAGLLLLVALGCKEQAVMVVPMAILVLLMVRRPAAAAGSRGETRGTAGGDAGRGSHGGPALPPEPPHPLPSTGANLLRRGILALAPLLPLGLAVALYLVARVTALGGLLGDIPQVVGRQAMGAGQMVWALGRAVELLVWPDGLTVTHAVGAAGWHALAAAAALAATVALVGRRRSPAVVLGLAWFWLTLIPTLQAVALPSASFAERHLYVMFAGLAPVTADLVAGALPRLGRPARLAAAALLAVAVTALAARTVARNRDWRDNRTLFESALAVSPSALAHLNLGNLARDSGDLATAAAHWRDAVALDPGDADALNQLGVLAAQAGRFAEAHALFARAVEALPTHAVAARNLARVEDRMGRPASGNRRRPR